MFLLVISARGGWQGPGVQAEIKPGTDNHCRAWGGTPHSAPTPSPRSLGLMHCSHELSGGHPQNPLFR